MELTVKMNKDEYDVLKKIYDTFADCGSGKCFANETKSNCPINAIGLCGCEHYSRVNVVEVLIKNACVSGIY